MGIAKKQEGYNQILKIFVLTITFIKLLLLYKSILDDWWLDLGFHSVLYA